MENFDSLYFHPELRAYLGALQDAGFTVYRHKNETMRADGTPRPAEYALYSRTVDGRELFGTVQLAQFWRLGQPLEHSMPIRPSREHGSSMFIEGREHETTSPSTVHYAELITRPTNHNHIVGSHYNYYSADDLARRFVVAHRIEVL